MPRVMEKFLEQYKQIDAVLSANDSMAPSALEALNAADRTAVVIGINGILPAVKEIESGNLLARVDFNMFKIGCTATRAAVRYLNRESLPDKLILPAEVIDKNNTRHGSCRWSSGPARNGASSSSRPASQGLSFASQRSALASRTRTARCRDRPSRLPSAAKPGLLCRRRGAPRCRVRALRAYGRAG